MLSFSEMPLIIGEPISDKVDSFYLKVCRRLSSETNLTIVLSSINQQYEVISMIMEALGDVQGV